MGDERDGRQGERRPEDPPRHGASLAGPCCEAVLFDWSEHARSSSRGTTSCSRQGTGGLRRSAGDDAGVHARAYRERRCSAPRPRPTDYARAARASSGVDEPDAFIDAEHEVWRPGARGARLGARAARVAARPRAEDAASSRTPGPSPRGSSARELESFGLARPRRRRSCSRERGRCAQARAGDLPARARRARRRRRRRDVRRRPPRDDVQGAATLGMTTVQALWFGADDSAGGGRAGLPGVHADGRAERRARATSARRAAKSSLAGVRKRSDNAAHDTTSRPPRAGAAAPSAGRDGVPPLRGPLRQGRLPGRVPRAELPVRLLLRGVGAHLRRLHAEGLRRRDRPRHAAGRRAARKPGFGAIRAVRQPLPMCQAEVEQTYESRSTRLGCVNPEFGELPVGEPTFRVFAQIKTG